MTQPTHVRFFVRLNGSETRSTDVPIENLKVEGGQSPMTLDGECLIWASDHEGLEYGFDLITEEGDVIDSQPFPRELFEA